MKPLVAVAAALASLAAQAQTPPAEYNNVIGPAVRSRPAYLGSNSQVHDLVPILDYEKGRFFARTVQGVLEAGLRTDVGSGFRLGGQVSYEEGRKKSESGFLRDNNVPDIGVGASLGLHAQWDGKVGPAPVVLVARWRQQLQSDRGSQTDARATVGVFQAGGFQAGIFGQATWGTQKSVRTYYGAPGFDPAGGLMFVSAGLLTSYDFARRWSLIVTLERSRLQGDAARSPLAERKSNSTAVAGIGWQF